MEATILQLAAMATSGAAPPAAASQQTSPPSASPPTASLPSIFVSVASYRDPEAPHTIRSLFAQAESPSRVHVGVCFQCELDGDEARRPAPLAPPVAVLALTL